MGAPESNAGDHYHLLWAVTKTLELILPGTDLHLVTLEGLSTVEEDDDTSQVVDLAEYYGGEDFHSATRVVVSQLKHSTKHPNKPWTVGRLCQGKKRRGPSGKTVSRRSLIGDLAQIYAEFVNAGHDRHALLDKLQIRLVSNQPADPTLLEAVAAAASYVRNADGPVERAALLDALDESHRDVVEKIKDAIGNRLPSGPFSDFLAALDLSQTGTLDRPALARQVTAETATLIPGRARSAALELYQLVHNQALPDPAERGIRRHAVLAVLGVGSEEDLYPAPQSLPYIPEPLPAPSSATIAEEVIRQPRQVIVAHGAAGVGKTTALQQVDSHLPTGSIVLIYDCYGGGQYLSTGEERHTTRRFAVQIINELAQICGTPLLLDPPPIEEDLWRRLSRTLEQTVETLEDDAVLVLAVDAADNAVAAGQRRNQPSFLTRLVELPLPEQVSIVLTARSHRVESLEAGNTPDVEIQPFDQDTSTEHLRRYRPDVSDELAEKFHERTGGNPRVQFYVLTTGESEEWNEEQLLDKCVETPEPLFEELVRSGLEVSPTDPGGQEWLSLLVALSRPVNIHTYAQALGVNTEQVRRFAKGLAPGVAVTDDTISFRDEDFESYVRDQVDDNEMMAAAHSKLATLLTSMAATDPDAAAHVAEHLFHAGRRDELVKLVLNEPVPAAIPDGLSRSEVQARRLDLAASVLAERGSPSDAVRLAFRTVEASARHHTLANLADTNLELVSRHVDLELLKSHLLRPAHRQSLAPQWMLLAAVLSRHESHRAEAVDALTHAESNLRRLIERAEAGEENAFRDISDDHVAAVAEAHYRLTGLRDAFEEIRRWGPVGFRQAVMTKLAQRIEGEVPTDTLEEEVQSYDVPPVAQIPLLLYATTPDEDPSQDWVDTTAEAVIGEEDLGREAEWRLPYAHVVARHANRDLAGRLLQRLHRELPAYASAYSYGLQEGTTELRIRALEVAVRGEELTLDSLLPAKLRPLGDEGEPDARAQERRTWQEAIKPLLPVARLEARAVVGDAGLDELVRLIDAELKERLGKAEHRWFRFDRTFGTWTTIAVEASVATQAPQDVIEQICQAAPKLLGSGAASLWLQIAGRLTRRSVHASYAADLCRRASLQVETEDLSSRDRLELLAEAAEIAGRVEPELGQRLFDSAVETASKINDEAAQSLEIYAELSRKIPLGEAPDRLAGKLIAATEAVAPHVTGDGLVPYRATLRAAARFDLDIAFAAASRWDDEDRIGLYATVPAAALSGLETGALGLQEALALDHLVDQADARLKFQLNVLHDVPPGTGGKPVVRRGVSRAAQWLRKHVAAHSQPALARQLLQWAEEHDADGAVRAELEAVTGFRPVTSQGHTRGHTRWSPLETDPEAQQLLEAAEARSWQTLPADTAVLRRAHVWGDRLAGFIETITRRAPANERVQALTALSKLDVQSDIVVKVLADRLDDWRGWPGLNTWAQEHLGTLLHHHLHRLLRDDDTSRLVEQLHRFASDDVIRTAVLAALPNARPHMRSYSTVHLAALLARLCPPEEAAQAVVPALDELLDASNATIPEGSAVPAHLPLARLLWSVFGHPNRTLRWRAAHATRKLLTTLPEPESRELTTSLVTHIDEPDPGSYRSPDLHFYEMSATAALLVALQRAARERPVVLSEHADRLVATATSTKNPHVEIRELARQAALAVMDPGSEKAEQLRFANRPNACSTDRSWKRADDRRDTEGVQYRFDSMDTLPYWYRPLADVFGVQLEQVAGHAEEWIVETCGLGEEDWMRDERELRDERSYERMSHRQGVIPVEESLRLYLEYHAMMIAAGRLVDADKPMHVSTQDEPDPWRSWLSRYLPGSEHGWLVHLRTAIPPEATLFKPPQSLEAWLQPDDDEYDDALVLDGAELPREVRVAGNLRLHHTDASKEVRISSALVSPETSPSLARALSSAQDPWDWKLPEVGEDEFEVDQEPYVLRGWLEQSYGGHEGSERHDPYAEGISRDLPLPGAAFQARTVTRADRTTLTVERPDGSVVARVEQWADPADETGSYFSSNGCRLYVTRDVLLDYLKAARMNLIVEVQIAGYRRGPDDTYERQSKLYVIDGDGHVRCW